MPKREVLVLAGLDPSGGAGLFADAEAIRASGCRPLCVPTALTVQTTKRARSFEPVSREYFLHAARALIDEEQIDAIKIGMIGSAEIASAIASLLDPVLASTSGAPLFRGSIDDARAAIRSLWTRAIVTPNAPEAALLLADRDPPQTEAALAGAAHALVESGAHAVVIKGGHASGAESVDLLLAPGIAAAPSARRLAPDARLERFAAPRLPANKRGTGCRFASALAANLARGNALSASVVAAKDLVLRYLRSE